jgi:microsomal dipeptidase-like Zn-dependent dipeptidase
MRTIWHLIIFLSLLFSPAVSTQSARAESGQATQVSRASDDPFVDLHAHLFFHEGIGTDLFGPFDGPIAASNWRSRIYGRVNSTNLEESNAALVVVALYSHPLFLKSYRDSIRAQIEVAQQFVQNHPDWIIARSAQQAIEARKEGKRILILSIEGASGILENEDDLDEFVGKWGVRIVTPLHFTDDRFGGAAFMRGVQIMANPLKALASLFSPKRDEFGQRVNPHGLSERGKKLVQSLIKRGVWIDLSHSSDLSQKDILELTLPAGQPPLYTHTILRSAFQAERAISPSELQVVKVHDGIIGILPSDDMLLGTHVDPRYCPPACQGKCTGGIAAFLTQYAQAVQATSPTSVMVGSDIDAPLSFLQPGCPAEATRNPRGYWEYSQLNDVWRAIPENGIIPASVQSKLVDVFLDHWAKVTPQP